MSEKFRLDRKIGFQNTFYTININIIIDSIGSSIILRSIADRPLVKSAYPKIIFLISQPKHMLWVLKRTVSM